MEEKELTFGEKAVGLTFNPSNDPTVQEMKEAAARFIDICDKARQVSMSGEQKRLLSVAITEAQTAQMWAVKGATWRD
jgi:hypothetical protein